MSEARPYPPRPFVPPVLAGLAALMVTGNLVLRGFASPLATGLACALPMVAALACALKVKERRAFLYCSFVGAGMLVASVQGSLVPSNLEAAADSLSSAPVSSLSLYVEGDAAQTASGWFVRASVRGGETQASVWLTLPERPNYGDTLKVIGRFEGNADDDWGRSSRARGVCGRIRAVRVVSADAAGGPVGLLMSLRRAVIALIKPERSAGRALMAGVLVSDRTELKSQDLEDPFARAGLSHLIAVSGSHLVVVGSVLEAMLSGLGTRPRTRMVGMSVITGGYVVLCACPPSAVRSWVMLIAGMLGRELGRRAHAPSGVALAGLGMCLLDPTCACDLGFVLSVLSVCALALFSGHVEALFERLLPPFQMWVRARKALFRRAPALAGKLDGALRGLRSAFASTLVCQAATLPACAATFGTVSLVAPLANVLVGPLFGPIVSFGMVACFFGGLPFAGPMLIGCCGLLCELAVWLAKVMATLPCAAVPVSLGAAWEFAPLIVAVMYLVVWPRPTRRCLLLALSALISAVAAACISMYVLVSPRLVVLDVGQGDAILIRRGTQAILVDTGPGDAVLEALARQHVLSIDAVIITHWHEDPNGGLEELVRTYDVGAVHVAEGASISSPLDEETNSIAGNLTEVRRGDVFEFSGFRLECLWPQESVSGTENEDSLCLKVSFAEGDACLDALLTGDAESSVLAEILPDVGDIDLLKVGHHGSAASITEDEAAMLSAEVAVASAGEGNRYGHPTDECVESLERAGTQFLCTKDVGDVTIEPGQMGPVVSTQR